MKILFFVVFVLHSTCYAAITCSPVTTALSISLPGTIDWQNETHADGMISNDWHTALNPKISVCNGNDVFSFVHTAPMASQGVYVYNAKSYALYPTPVEGIGYIMEIKAISGAWLSVAALGFVSWTTNNSLGYLNQQPIEIGVRIRLVATRKKLTSGSYSIPAFSVVDSYFNTNNGKFFMGRTTSSGTALVAKSKSCTVSSSSLVTLPRSNLSTFKSVGNTSGDTNFNLALKCADSFVGYAVSYFMTDAYDRTNSGSTLATSLVKGAVSGLAIEILDSASPIRFGSSSTTLNTQLIGRVSGATTTNLVKQLTARYVRVGSTMSPGLLNSGVIVTLMYD